MLVFLNAENHINVKISPDINNLISQLKNPYINLDNVFFCKTNEIRCILIKKENVSNDNIATYNVKCIFVLGTEIISVTIPTNNLEEIFAFFNKIINSTSWIKCETTTDYFLINTIYLKGITISKIEHNLNEKNDLENVTK